MVSVNFFDAKIERKSGEYSVRKEQLEDVLSFITLISNFILGSRGGFGKFV